ncbi:thiamine pyrophosphate-binding protein [Qaidamihabitans albus]|uniref:thiamine pyrophosphate-binding protein n=1 Tax=Qaidamihabitans albus TaxID=2795733 RepID=UPI0018F1C748|nr:thiamine pyrophosphate-binding protein [Qaidamihabitans albus]
MSSISSGQSIVNVLRGEGTTHVYGMPGGHILGILDAVARTEGIRSVLVRHEHTAASMAAAHAQLTGEPGVVLVTAGPGLTNTLTAVTEAYVGALPMLVLAGRGSTETAYRGASQEVSTDKIFAPVTKWSVRADRADLLADIVRQAFVIARSGKPGPVLVDIPRDLLAQEVEPRERIPVGRPSRVGADPAVVSKAARLLGAADRPLIVAGGGVLASEATDVVRRIAEVMCAPVLTSLAGRGSLPDDHPLAAGGLGAHRNPVSKRLLQEADVVLGLGTRFEEMETNWHPGALPASGATYIQVDVDPEELGRSVPTQLPIVADVGRAVEQVLEKLEVDVGKRNTRESELSLSRQQLDILRQEIATMAASNEIPIHPVRVIREARQVFPRDSIVGFDVGALAQHIAGAFPYFEVYEARSTVVPSSFYGMGFAASGILAAKMVHPHRPALCFVGDGSFQMSMATLPTATDHQLGVTWCILDDGALGSIWDLQHHAYDDRIVDTEFSFQPDFAALARSCGAHGETVDEPAEVGPALHRALKANAGGVPAVVDARVARVRLKQTREHYFAIFPQE